MSGQGDSEVVVAVVWVVNYSGVNLVNGYSYVCVFSADHSGQGLVASSGLVHSQAVAHCSRDYFQDTNSLVVFDEVFERNPENSIIMTFDPQSLFIF